MTDYTKLVVATPIRAHDVRTAMQPIGYTEFIKELEHRGATYYGGAITFSTDCVRGRNRLLGAALRDQPDFTHILWCDDDQYPESLDAVDKLIDSGEDLIGIPYTNKFPPLRWVYQPWEVACAPDSRGIADVRGVGLGFTMMSRACIDKVCSASKWYTDLPETWNVPNAFYMDYDHIGPFLVYQSEDYAFCKRWRDMGGRVKVHTGAVIYHCGSKAWSGRDMPGGIL